MDQAPPEDFKFPTADDHEQSSAEATVHAPSEPSEAAIDQGVAESFPASDPVSVTVSQVVAPAAETAPDDPVTP